MNLDLLKQEKKVQTNEKHPNIPVITLLAKNKGENEKTIKMLKFNINALTELGVGSIGKEDYTRIVVFNNYLVSNPDEDNRFDLALFITNQKVIKANKNYKSYEIALGTRKCVSNEIYDALVERFNLDTTVDNYIQLIPTHARTGGAFSFKLISEEVEKTIELFDKGEDVEVEMQQF